MKHAFSYFGSKAGKVHLYPAPEYDTIIEPFAGSAAYAEKYWDRRVLLYEIDPVIVETWKFLIAADYQDILDLPLITSRNDRVEDFDIPQGAKNLIGFKIATGQEGPRNTPTHWSLTKKLWDHRNRRILAEHVHKYNHWKITQGSWEQAPHAWATWFIDPPYQHEGRGYKHSAVDYRALAHRVKQMRGQVIVCESAGATWLPFEPLSRIKTNRNKNKEYTEMIWTNG